MRILMQVIGGLMIAMGLLWVGQGAGLIHWPESSFMLDQRPWMWRGALLAGIGAAVIAVASKRRR